MNSEGLLTESLLDELVHRNGPAAIAWLTRVHRELSARCAGSYVFRLDEDLDDLIKWMSAAGITPTADRLLPSITFDIDRDGPRSGADGGWLQFEWDRREYRLLGLCLANSKGDRNCVWISCADGAAAEALVDAVGRHTWKRQARVMVFEDGDWEEAPRLADELATCTWDSVVLPADTRERLRRAAELFFQSGGLYADLEIPWKLGFLFAGPPGTGKTLTTKILANTCGVPFLYVRGLTNHRGGRADQKTIHEMFQGARERSPCILCIEDVDSLVTDELRSTFLNEMDGIETGYNGVLTVATSNHPERLDPALLHRPSRFDYRFEFPLPEDDQRRAYGWYWTVKLARLGYVSAPEAGIEEIVRRSRGMSMAYLKRVLIGTVMRMHTQEERGDAAFARIVAEELADAQRDYSGARRMVSTCADGQPQIARVGFRMED